MPRWRAKARSAAAFSADIIQPVGLPGEFTKIARVRSSQASNTRCRSSFQPPSGVGVSATGFAVPPMMSTAALTLGHTGEITTALSPGSMIACMVSMIALMPEEVTTTFSWLTGRACRPVRYVASAWRSCGMPRLKV